LENRSLDGTAKKDVLTGRVVGPEKIFSHKAGRGKRSPKTKQTTTDAVDHRVTGPPDAFAPEPALIRKCRPWSVAASRRAKHPRRRHESDETSPKYRGEDGSRPGVGGGGGSLSAST